MFSPELLLIGGGVVAVLALLFFVYRKGRQAEQDKQLRSRMKARDTADDVEDAVAGRTETENKARLRRW